MHGEKLKILSVFVACYLAYNAHVPYYTVICGLSDSTILFHIISQMARYANVSEHKTCVFIFTINSL